MFGPATRLRSLDVLRALACLMVIGNHFAEPAAAIWSPLRSFFATWQFIGWTGVDLFFVLSGFLVSGLLFREYRKHGRIKLARFFIRRGLKIYPAFYAFFLFWLIGYLAVDAAGVQEKNITAANVVSELLFIQNYAWAIWGMSDGHPLMGHTWSLAVEEHFYISIGLFLLLCSMRGGENPFRPILLLWICVAVGTLSLRFGTSLVWFDAYDHRTHSFPSHLRMDALLFGVLLSYGYHFHHEPMIGLINRFRWPIGLLSAAAISIIFKWNAGEQAMHTWGFSVINLGFGGLLMLAVVPRDGDAAKEEKKTGVAGAFDRALTFLASIGFYSYSIYLWHYPIADVFKKLIIDHPRLVGLLGDINVRHTVLFVVYTGVTVVVGIIAAKIVEMPVLRLRDRVFPSRTPGM